MNLILKRIVVGGIIVAAPAIYKGARYVIDNKIRGTVSSPAIGGIVYCNLLSAAEHSGVYVGNGNIIHLDGNGVIVKTSAQTFIKRLDGWNPARTIYTLCKGKEPVGIADAAAYAEGQVGRRVKYSLAKNNCHRFTASCLLGEESPVSYLLMGAVKSIHDEIIGKSTGRVWNWR